MRLRRLAGAATSVIRRTLGEPAVALYASAVVRARATDGVPRSIFVLRNNDLGDVLLMTPLLEGLRRCAPDARIVAGVGRWARDILSGNPHVSEVMTVNAPWFNHVVTPHGFADRLRFATASDTARDLRTAHFDAGIDVLGSVWGSLLLARAGIPRRLGVRGYAGGHLAATASIPFDPNEHVARSALRFAELLGLPAGQLPGLRPQVFLTPEERAAGQRRWHSDAARPLTRIVIGPGTGDPPKGWPHDHFSALVTSLAARPDVSLLVLGAAHDRTVAEALAARGTNVTSVAGQLNLRDTFAVVAAADLVVTNASMLMHAAAAFSRQTVVLLGPAMASARQHDRQWGYPGTCISLGNEPGTHAGLATPAEALAAVDAALAVVRR